MSGGLPQCEQHLTPSHHDSYAGGSQTLRSAQSMPAFEAPDLPGSLAHDWNVGLQDTDLHLAAMSSLMGLDVLQPDGMLVGH